MKVLHIGDIHLGCRLENNSRNQEIGKVFDFIKKTVDAQQIKAVLMAGDIFDNRHPTPESQDLYYNFLLDVKDAGCTQVVVIAGNHDSPYLLDAPKWLLERLDIHVIGNIDPEHLEKEVIPLGDKESPYAYVCAVPFLKTDNTNEKIAAHYQKLWQIANSMRKDTSIPIIGMGHLFASGSTFRNTTDEANVVGKLESVELKEFAEPFDYMALGHIHKPQRVAEHDNWRYAGSILPMQIQRNAYATQVIVLDTENLSNPQGVEIPDDCFHKMAYIEGNINDLRTQLEALRNTDTWVKAVYTGQEAKPNWSIDLRLEFRQAQFRIVETDESRLHENQTATAIEEPDFIPLSELQPIDVYDRYMEQHSNETTEEQRETLRALYLEAQNNVYSPEQQQEQNVRTSNGVMKFKSLYIKNVNSLYGEHYIDFTNPAFQDGIFLISGPTGAGKSSILDAICLALYKGTPRVKEITKSNNPVMSLGQLEMEVSLTFTMGKDEYCAKLYQNRAHRSQNLQNPQHTLSKNGTQIAASLTDTSKKITELIGLNLLQFTQCVLLAQGSFDKFLKSNSESRSAILSKITGTEIYKKIGEEISSRNNDVKRIKAAQETLLENITILPETEVETCQKELESNQKQKDDFQKQLTTYKLLEQTFTNLKSCEENAQNATKAYEDAQKAYTEAEDKRLAVTDAERAQRCENEFNAWKQHSDALQKNELETQALQNKKLNLTAALEKKLLNQKSADDDLKTRLQQQETEQKLYTQVRELDINIKNTEQKAKEALKNHNTAKNTKTEAENRFQVADKIWQGKQAKAEESQNYLQSHQADQTLSGRQENWELRRKALQTQEKENATEQADIQKAELDLAERSKSLKRELKKQETTANKRDAKHDEIKALTKEKEECLGGKTILELKDLQIAACKLQDFFNGELSRATFLAQGKRCPLCGSLEHPYCDGTTVPEPHDYNQDMEALATRIKKIQDYESKINSASTEQYKLNAELGMLEVTCKNLKEQLEKDSNALEVRRKKLMDAQQAAADGAKVLAEELKLALQVEWTSHNALPKELALRIKAFNDAQAVVNELELAKQAYQQAEAAYDAVKDNNAKALEEAKLALNQVNADLATLKDERQKLFGTDSVEDREQKLTKDVDQARKALELVAQAVTKAQADKDNNQTALDDNAKKSADLSTEVASLHQVLIMQLQTNGFTDEEDFKKAQISIEKLQQLQTELHNLDQTRASAKATLDTREQLLAEAKTKVPENTTLEEIQEKQKSTQEDVQKLEAQILALKTKLKHNEDNIQKNANALEKLQNLETLCNNWETLNKAFGVNQGKGFENIAQGYTFSALLHCANQNRLTFLRNHFTLVNDKNDPLVLNVIDHYRGDLVRSASNLSGGEQFEVSLALALGLSNMSSISQNASLGNVLLDEGFGTLDDNALDSALELLTSLNTRDGKLVGIISHVAKLEERIAAQIHVSTSGGMGTLTGAGVK